MNGAIFIDRVKAILADNGGIRMHPNQLHGTALDTPHLALADAGCRRIFTQPERRLFRDYHIHLLIDVSGSMKGTRCEQAAIATHALEHALSASGATMSAALFNAKYVPLELKTIKNIDELYKAMVKACEENGSGCTHTAYAIDRAKTKLELGTSSPSRIILVLTDGGACCGTCSHPGSVLVSRYSNQKLACIRSIREARTSCTVLAIGIEDEDRAPEVFGKQEGISITSSNQLYKAALSLLSRAVKRG